MAFVRDCVPCKKSHRNEEKTWNRHGEGVFEENQLLAKSQATLHH